MEDLMPGEIASGWQLVLEREEENAECISDPATGEEDQHGWGETLGEGVESDEDKPAHEEVEADRESGVQPQVKEFDTKPNESQSPDDPKERPTPATLERDEEHRGIGPSDEDGDERMVETSRPGLGAWPKGRDEVIARTGKVKEYHPSTKERVAGDVPGISRSTLDQENDEDGDGSANTREME